MLFFGPCFLACDWSLFKMKHYFLTFFLGLAFTQTIFASPLENIQLKSGTLTKNEIWSGNILLNDNVIVPKLTKLTIQPHTQIIFAPALSRLNEADNLSKLIINGTLNTPKPNTISLIHIDDYKFGPVPSSQTLKIAPAPLSMAPIVAEMRAYKINYIVTWSLIYAILLVFT